MIEWLDIMIIEWLDIMIIVTVAVLFSIPILWGFWQATELARTMEKRMETQARQIAELETRVTDLTEGRSADHDEMRELRDGIGRLVDQLRKANMEPVWTPDQVKRQPRNKAAVLARRIATGFTVEEMSGLAFEIGLSGDELRGDTRDERARALVTYMENRGRLSDLRRLVDEQRPQK